MMPGAHFSPRFKARLWDGLIRLFDYRTHRIYRGLVPHIERICQERNYKFVYNDYAQEFSVKEANEFIETLNLPNKPYDHQLEAFVYGVRNRRAVLLSPTSSGKSLLIYLYIRYLLSKGHKKILVIASTTSLVLQMKSDFKEYGYDVDNHVHQIYEGQSKTTDMPVVISTWQSIYEMPKKFFDEYDAVIGDEAHHYKSKSVTAIMTKLTNASFRVGMTGTLDGIDTNKMVLEGLFGTVKKVITTKELMERGIVADFDIKAIVLKHPEDVCKALKGKSYQEEIKTIIQSEGRNRFITNLALSLEGNTLLLFQYVEAHGLPLYKMIQDKASDRKVFFISGDVEAEIRETIRHIVETENDAIIVASFGTMSTGVNIKSIRNVIFASPSKSRVRNLQSIGRALRKSKTKTEATLYDIADDLRTAKKENYTLSHFVHRLKLYAEESFKFKVYKVNLKG